MQNFSIEKQGLKNHPFENCIDVEFLRTRNLQLAGEAQWQKECSKVVKSIDVPFDGRGDIAPTIAKNIARYNDKCLEMKNWAFPFSFFMVSPTFDKPENYGDYAKTVAKNAYFTPLVRFAAQYVRSQLNLTTSVDGDKKDNYIAIHYRQFRYHCEYLYPNNVLRMPTGWNRFDKALYKRIATMNKTAYMLHCDPTVEQVAARVLEVIKAANQTANIKHVFVATNANHDVTHKLAKLLSGYTVSGIADVPKRTSLPGWISQYDALIDMEIASKAVLFIGNIVSTFTSNIMQFRTLRDGRPEGSNYHW